MNLGGVPTQGGQGTPLPRLGPPLRDIASEAVRKVYNHGAGKARGKYENEREALAHRFRIQYGSEGIGADGEGQGNVQPIFVGAFDKVAALRSRSEERRGGKGGVSTGRSRGSPDILKKQNNKQDGRK